MKISTTANRWLLVIITITALLLSLLIGGCYDNGYNPDKDPFYMMKKVPAQEMT